MFLFSVRASEQEYINEQKMDAWSAFWWIWEYRGIRHPFKILWGTIWWVPFIAAVFLLFFVTLIYRLDYQEAKDVLFEGPL